LTPVRGARRSFYLAAEFIIHPGAHNPHCVERLQATGKTELEVRIASGLETSRVASKIDIQSFRLDRPPRIESVSDAAAGDGSDLGRAEIVENFRLYRAVRDITDTVISFAIGKTGCQEAPQRSG
jgi:hypothetical protein